MNKQVQEARNTLPPSWRADPPRPEHCELATAVAQLVPGNCHTGQLLQQTSFGMSSGGAAPRIHTQCWRRQGETHVKRRLRWQESNQTKVAERSQERSWHRAANDLRQTGSLGLCKDCSWVFTLVPGGWVSSRCSTVMKITTKAYDWLTASVRAGRRWACHFYRLHKTA